MTASDPRWPGPELLIILAQRPHALAEGGGLVVLAGGAQSGGGAAAQVIERFPGPFDDMERIQADVRLRRFRPDHVMDPLRAAGGHVGQQLAALRAEGAEERGHGVLAAALTDPGDRPGEVVRDDHQVFVTAGSPGFLVDPDHGQPVEAVRSRGGVRGDAGRDVRQRLPRDPQFGRHSGPGGVRGLPRRELLKRAGKPVIMTGPRHGGGDLAVLRAPDPGQGRFQERPLAVHIQGPPPFHVVLGGFAALPALRAQEPVSRAYEAFAATVISRDRL